MPLCEGSLRLDFERAHFYSRLTCRTFQGGGQHDSARVHNFFCSSLYFVKQEHFKVEVHLVHFFCPSLYSVKQAPYENQPLLFQNDKR